jgi:hypothetical protein
MGRGRANRLAGRSRKDAGRFPPLTGLSCTAWSGVGQRYTGPVRFPTIRQQCEAIATLARGCPERGEGASRRLQETEAGNASVGAKMPFFSVSQSASRLTVPCRHGRWAGDGWGGACSRAHRARSNGADPVEQRYPRRRRLAWLDWSQGQVSGRETGKVLGVLDWRRHTRFAGEATRHRKCCLSS